MLAPLGKKGVSEPRLRVRLCWQVRAITGLGLKEAKEVVEKAPSELKGVRAQGAVPAL